MVSYDVLGLGGRVILRAQTPFVQSDVKRPLLSVGELTQSGAEVKFGDKNSWIDLQTNSGVQRVPVRVKGKTSGLLIQKTDAWIIPETSDPAPHAAVAPVDEEIGRPEQPIAALAAPEAAAAPRAEETQGMRLERDDRDLAADWQRTRQLGQPLGEGGLSSGSNVEKHAKPALGAPVWGKKAQMWPRIVHAEARRELQKRDEAWLADRVRELAEAGGQGELRVPRGPEEPSAEARARHEITHLTYRPWCAWCVMEKGRVKTSPAATSGEREGS